MVIWMPSGEPNENLKTFLKLTDDLRQAKAEKKERSKLRANAVRLLKRKKRLEQQLKETAEKFDSILYDDKVFSDIDRRKFMEKHGL